LKDLKTKMERIINSSYSNIGGIIVLKNAIGENIVSDAKNIVNEYKETYS